jgi:DNA-binding XRE family transcriptional regulator
MSNQARDELISFLTSQLVVLRAKLGLTQDEISSAIGVSRQTYIMIEREKQKMSWTVFMALVGLFQNNEGSAEILGKYGFFESSSFTSTVNVHKGKYNV